MKINKKNAAPRCASFSLRVGLFFLIQSQVRRLEKHLVLLQTLCAILYTHFSINTTEIFPTDDSEHEWIVRTCRKAWDEAVGVDPEKSVATRTEETRKTN